MTLPIIEHVTFHIRSECSNHSCLWIKHAVIWAEQKYVMVSLICYLPEWGCIVYQH